MNNINLIQNICMSNDEVFVKINQYMIPNIQPYYYISNFGRLYSIYSNTFISQHETESGYLQSSLMLNNGARVFRKIHRLVMLAFNYIPDNEIFQVNHKDGNHKNNCLYNLEWCTAKENVNHAIRTGLRQSFSGEQNIHAILSNESARKVGEMLISGYSDDDIIKILNIPNKEIIRLIASGKTWNNIFTTDEHVLMQKTRRGSYISINEKYELGKYYAANKDKCANVINLIHNALISINLSCSDRNIRIAKRLYYGYDNPEIKELYKF